MGLHSLAAIASKSRSQSAAGSEKVGDAASFAMRSFCPGVCTTTLVEVEYLAAKKVARRWQSAAERFAPIRCISSTGERTASTVFVELAPVAVLAATAAIAVFVDWGSPGDSRI